MSNKGARKIHKGSRLLSQEENQKLFMLIGPKCLSLASGVIQLYSTEPPAHAHWIKQATGVICLIKDNLKKSYFLRLYCLTNETILYEQECYIGIKFNLSRPYLINFEGPETIISLNFASGDEALNFHENVVRYTNRKQKENRKSANLSKTSTQKPDEIDQESPVILRNDKMTAQNFQVLFSENRQRVKKNPGISKTAIGNPSSFVHVAHVGFHQDQGFDSHGDNGIVQQFLKKVGVYDQYTNDRETKAYIDEFLLKTNTIDQIKSEIGKNKISNTNFRNEKNITIPKKSSNAIPAPPLRSPPMPKTPAPVLADNIKKEFDLKQKKGSRSPNVTTGGAPPPPPPPLPPPVLAPPPPPTYSIDDAASNNNSHSKVNQTQEAGGGDQHSALLDSIRKGTTLKKTNITEENRSIGKSKDTDPGGNQKIDLLASALITALNQRGQFMRSSGESESESDNEDWD